MKCQDVELLAPAGSYDSLKAAVSAGADAIYLAGNKFGARAFANNFTEEELLDAIDFAHLHGCKIYLAVNTLLKDKELSIELHSYLKPLYERGLDAVIVQDIGVLSFIRENFAELPIHASTQMNVTNEQGAQFLQDNGVSRVVLARELSLDEICNIVADTEIEIECFVHGALCYSYSGQCLFSSFIGGRSGNRGQCAQPCRLPYEGQDIFSLKDMCALRHIPDLITAGIHSFKIEGRMKTPEYVAAVVSIYRKHIDKYMSEGYKGYDVSEQDMETLMEAYNRDGEHSGYLYQTNGRDMLALDKPKTRTRNEQLFSELRAKYVETESKEKINGKLTLCAEKPATLELEFGGIRVEVSTKFVERAKNCPISILDVKKHVSQLGNTSFVFEHLDIKMDEDIFISTKDLKMLRREAIAQLTETILSQYYRTSKDYQYQRKSENKQELSDTKQLYVSVETIEQFDIAIKYEEVKRIYVEITMLNQIKKVLSNNQVAKEIYLAMPFIFRKNTQQIFEERYEELLEVCDGILVRSYDGYKFLRKKAYSKKIVVDYPLYTMNRQSKEFWKREGIEQTTAPLEINRYELAAMENDTVELVGYGYLPMMISAGCTRKNLTKCNKVDGAVKVKDRYKKEFIVKNYCEYCYNIVYNFAPLWLCDRMKELSQLSIRALRLQFVYESDKEMQAVLQAYIEGLRTGKKSVCTGEFTRGHFERGIR